MRRVLLTGGAGFIGLRLAARLAAAGAGPIWLYDSLHPQVHGPDAPPPALPPPLAAAGRFVRGDVRDAAALAACVAAADPEIVVHLAAETGTGQSAALAGLHRAVNVGGMENLIAALRAHAPGLRRLVLPSSRAVYGEGPWRRADGTVLVPPPRTDADLAAGRFDPVDPAERAAALTPLPATEATPPAPASVYAETKLAQERLVTAAGLPGCRAVILRLQNAYGPGQSLRNPYTGIVSIFVQQARERGRLEVYEDGNITRDFVHVDDVTAALAAALAAELPDGAVLNIGSGRAVTLREVARLMLGPLGLPAGAIEVSGRFRIGDVRHAVADIAAARRALGWAPTVDLRAGLDSVVDWARSAG